MAKFKKFIPTESIGLSEREKIIFTRRISKLIRKYVDFPTEESFSENMIHGFEIHFNNTENEREDDISYDAIIIAIYKEKGYIDNYDWELKKCIDETRPARDYESAPLFQYFCNLVIVGYDSVNQKPLNIARLDYGTTIGDIDFEPALKELFGKH